MLTDHGQALTAARDLAGVIAANGPLAVQASKKIITDAMRWTDPDAFEGQRAIAGPVMTSADAREGAAAFAEKRVPVWQGK